jgi:hypothetical protein
MKTQIIKIGLLVCIVAAVCKTDAQITTPEGEIQSGKDTTNFHDKPYMHVHEQTTVINTTPAQNGGRANENGTVPAQNKMSNQGEMAANTDTMDNVSNNEGYGASSGMIMVTNNGTSGINIKNVIYTALTVFGIGTLIGLFLISMVLRNRKAPLWLAMVHGALGLMGIGILIAYAINYPGPVIAIVLLAVAATSGLMFFFQDIRQQQVPKWLAATHAVIAGAGVLCLILFAAYR